MQAQDIQNWGFKRPDAAYIVGITEGQLANWLDRYDLFEEKRCGSGSHISFRLSDLMKLAAMRLLTEHGFKPSEASDALRPYAGPYAALLHNTVDRARYPGSSFLTRNSEGRWVGADGADKAIAVEIRAWPIFDEIYPRMKKVILTTAGYSEHALRSAAIDEFEAQIERIRRDRWSVA
jgi:hypothetical protein